MAARLWPTALPAQVQLYLFNITNENIGKRSNEFIHVLLSTLPKRNK